MVKTLILSTWNDDEPVDCTEMDVFWKDGDVWSYPLVPYQKGLEFKMGCTWTFEYNGKMLKDSDWEMRESGKVAILRRFVE